MPSFSADESDIDTLINLPIQYVPLPYVPFRQSIFTSKSKYRHLQKLKLFLGACTLLPLRILLIIFCIITNYLASLIFWYNKKPLTDTANIKESDWTSVFINRITRLCLFGFGLTSIEFKGKVPVDYEQNSPWLKYSVIAAPHSSIYDWSIAIARATRVLSPIMKKSAMEIPILNNVFRGVMPVIVDRSSIQNRKNTVTEIIKRMTEGFKQNWFPLLCFPEGTCGNRKQFLKFKVGAFIPGKPLIPILIKYTQDYDTNENDLATLAHFGRPVPITILLAMCRLQNGIIYNFLDPYYPTEIEKNNPVIYAENVRQYMSKEGKIPVSNWTFEDAKLMRYCEKYKFQPEIGAIKAAKIFEVKNYEKIANILLKKYISILEKYMPKREFNRITGLIPAIEKLILLKELEKFKISEKSFEFGEINSEIYNFNSKIEKLNDILPHYVTFEQFCICFAKVNDLSKDKQI